MWKRMLLSFVLILSTVSCTVPGQKQDQALRIEDSQVQRVDQRQVAVQATGANVSDTDSIGQIVTENNEGPSLGVIGILLGFALLLGILMPQPRFIKLLFRS